MLDENLPTFVLSPSKDKPRQHATILFSHRGAEFEPEYTLRHLDPEQHASRNRYAAGLYDAFAPDVLYAEVLLIPEWTQAAGAGEGGKSNGALPPPPEPLLPSEFAIQLYNPDQQVTVRYKAASWNTAATWEFEMPQQTFRTPSASALDRGQHDPAASDVTPKIGFKWKKDGKFSKDLACFLSGKTTDVEGARPKSKEPDITVSIFKGLKEITLYQPNLQRVEIEDLKGFEVVLLLGAVVIRDVYFGSLKDTFNVGPPAGRKSHPSSPTAAPLDLRSQSVSPTLPHRPGRDPRIPPTDPRSQWEIDAETARLRRQAAEEGRDRRRREEEAERKTRALLEMEEKAESNRRQAEIDRETQRLRQLYGNEDASARPSLPPREPRRHSHQPVPTNAPPVPTLAQYAPTMQPNAWGGYSAAPPPPIPYGSGSASQSAYLAPQPPNLKPKQSIFSFRRRSDQDSKKLQRKRSAVF